MPQKVKVGLHWSGREAGGAGLQPGHSVVWIAGLGPALHVPDPHLHATHPAVTRQDFRMLDDKEFLERMRLTYLEESREKIQSMYALLDNWASSPDNLGAFQSFERAVHNLVGSGASFGVPRITDAGKAYENFLNWFKEKRLKLNPQRLAVMREAINEIDAIFNGERRGTPVDVSSCRVLTIFKNSTG